MCLSYLIHIYVKGLEMSDTPEATIHKHILGYNLILI